MLQPPVRSTDSMGELSRTPPVAARAHRSHPHTSGPLFPTCPTGRLRAALGCPPASPAPRYRGQGHAAPAPAPPP